jgi:hypothetical protein
MHSAAPCAADAVAYKWLQTSAFRYTIQTTKLIKHQ